MNLIIFLNFFFLCFFLNKESKLYCQYCTYVIKVTGLETLVGSFSVIHSDEFFRLEDGKVFYDFDPAGTHNLY